MTSNTPLLDADRAVRKIVEEKALRGEWLSFREWLSCGFPIAAQEDSFWRSVTFRKSYRVKAEFLDALREVRK